MIWGRRKPQPTDRELVGFADGSLPASRREGVERAVASSPELQADLASQRVALQAIAAAAGERAPSALRARLELARDPRKQLRTRRPIGAVAAAGTAAIAAALVLTLGGGPTGAPTVAAAATLANRGPDMPTGLRANSDTLVWPSASGLPFPNWARAFGYTAFGSRRDRIDGRQATTVFYAGERELLAYTIISGAPLAAGSTTHAWVWDHLALRSFSSRGRAVVTWTRDGHTCVLSAARTPLKDMLQLAAWKDAA